MYTSCFKHTHIKRLHTEIQHLCQCCLLLHWVSRVNVEATAYAGSLLDPSHYPSVINDSVNTSSWLFKAPNVPTSTMWFQHALIIYPEKIGREQASNYGFAPCSQHLITELFENRMNPTLLLLLLLISVFVFSFFLFLITVPCDFEFFFQFDVDVTGSVIHVYLTRVLGKEC